MPTVAQLLPQVLWGAFLLAVVFGFVASRTHFCTMGAVADIVNMDDWARMRMWLLAIAVAMLGTTALQWAGLIDTSKAIYTTPAFPWLSYLLGGGLFGFGMVLASGCGSKTLIRIGGGNLKSLVVFVVLGITAFMTLKGIFGVWRVTLLDPLSFTTGGPQDLPSLLAAASGIPRSKVLPVVAGVLGLALLMFVLRNAEFRHDREKLIGGAVIGALIVGGWYVSGNLGYLAEDPETLQEAFVATNSGRMESFSFVSPFAYTLDLLMFWSDKSKAASFGIVAVLGVILGSLLDALLSKSFRWEGFVSAEDTAQHLVGAALMGFGGVTALGCTVGQGLSGVSTLAVGSLLVTAAIIAGAVAGLKYQYWRIMQEA